MSRLMIVEEISGIYIFCFVNVIIRNNTFNIIQLKVITSFNVNYTSMRIL